MNSDPLNQDPASQTPSTPNPTYQPPPAQTHEQQSRMWGMLCHLAALAIFVGIPLGNIIGPLVVWLIKKDEFPFVNDQGKESLNFQISMTIYCAVAFVLAFLLIGIPALLALLLIDVIFIIIAAVDANAGKAYRYPVTIRFIS